MPGELAQIGMLKGDTTNWTPLRPLPAGKYYWHVAPRAGTALSGEQAARRAQAHDGQLPHRLRKQDLSTWVLPETVKKGARLLRRHTQERGWAKVSKTIALRAP
jgi:hypothetical protein